MSNLASLFYTWVLLFTILTLFVQVSCMHSNGLSSDFLSSDLMRGVDITYLIYFALDIVSLATLHKKPHQLGFF